ncbi:MAG TPA: Yip1 family protein [Anaerolineales bacterium]|nr:Yip1 family protein [Anaerolineales bacterium]HLO29654.1 Yip1 family protein [Anaerolineales bacterium]
MNNTASPHLKSFKDYYVGTLFRPRQTFDLLLTDSRRLKFGLLAIAFNAILYTFVYIFLTIGGSAPSAFKPWLAVPTDVYYYYNRFWLAPSMFGCWILAAGVAHLLSRLFSGKGSFEDTLSVFGFGITIASAFSLLHDLTDSFLGAIGLLDLRWYEVALNSPTIWRAILWILYSIFGILMPVLLIKGVRAAQRIKPAPALMIGLLAFVIYQGIFFVFNR